MPLEWLFGRRMTPDEMLRKNQRALNKAMRDLDRENMRMEQQEKKIILDIKKMAKDGQMVNYTFVFCIFLILKNCGNYRYPTSIRITFLKVTKYLVPIHTIQLM